MRTTDDYIRAAARVTGLSVSSIRNGTERGGPHGKARFVVSGTLFDARVALTLIIRRNGRGWMLTARALRRNHSTIYKNARDRGGDPEVIALADRIEREAHEAPTWADIARTYVEQWKAECAAMSGSDTALNA